MFKTREVEQLRPDDFYEAAYYSPSKRSRRDTRFEHRVRKASRQIETAQEFGGFASLLDIGCSVGFVMEAGKRLGISSAGMDVSTYAVEQCRSRGYRAEVGTLEKMPWKDGDFDLVIMKHVLEHTPDPASALSEVRRVTKPGSLVLVAVPDLGYWKGLLLRRSYRYFRPDDLGRQHYVYYTESTLRRVLEKEGFAVLATTKAVFRRQAASRSALRRILEPLRWAVLQLTASLSAICHLRRELVFVARRQ